MSGGLSIWAFDFDGVICDSARETGRAGLLACEDLFGTATSKLDIDSLLEGFCKARPILETGWEAVIMLQLLSEGIPVDDLIAQFQRGMKAATITRLGVSESDVKQAFKKARNSWIERDAQGWLAAHGFYDKVVASVKDLVQKVSDTVQVYVITTKGKEFALQLLDAAGIPLSPERVFGLGSGPKAEVLKSILEKESQKTNNTRCVFFEDRLDTLLNVEESLAKGRSDILLGLVDWGYNTQEDQDKARSHEHITLWNQVKAQYIIIKKLKPRIQNRFTELTATPNLHHNAEFR
eukprot:m.122124 g.122124  ORF g.122124 m.122124 type:complete len:293 (+) comp14417_c0_seq1:195-1073(+)